MEKPILQLEPGQTVIAVIADGLTFCETHDGWTLKITSEQPLAVRPEDTKTVRIVTMGGVQL